MPLNSHLKNGRKSQQRSQFTTGRHSSWKASRCAALRPPLKCAVMIVERERERERGRRGRGSFGRRTESRPKLMVIALSSPRRLPLRLRRRGGGGHRIALPSPVHAAPHASFCMSLLWSYAYAWYIACCCAPQTPLSLSLSLREDEGRQGRSHLAWHGRVPLAPPPARARRTTGKRR